MNKGRRINKLISCRKHRQVWYERSLDKLINGEVNPEYVSLRSKKLKDVNK